MTRLAWHFIGADWRTTNGGLLVEVGKPLIHGGELRLRYSGLHASRRAIDALTYAYGPVITLVRCAGEFVDHDDKFVCRRRTALWGYDCTEELRTFARLAASEVLHLWDAPDVVREWLETGDPALQSAAYSAAYSAWSAAAAARSAYSVYSAAESAAESAVWAADSARAVWAAAYSAAASALASADMKDRQNEMLESLLLDGAVSRGLV